MRLVFGDRAVAEASPRPSVWSEKGREGTEDGLTECDTKSQEPGKHGTKRRLKRAWPGRQEESQGAESGQWLRDKYQREVG